MNKRELYRATAFLCPRKKNIFPVFVWLVFFFHSFRSHSPFIFNCMQTFMKHPSAKCINAFSNVNRFVAARLPPRPPPSSESSFPFKSKCLHSGVTKEEKFLRFSFYVVTLTCTRNSRSQLKLACEAPPRAADRSVRLPSFYARDKTTRVN